MQRHELLRPKAALEGVVLSTNTEYLRNMKINPRAMAANTHKMTRSNEHDNKDYYTPWFSPDDNLIEAINARKAEFMNHPNEVACIDYNDNSLRMASQELLELQATHLAEIYPDVYDISSNFQGEIFINNKLNNDGYSLMEHSAGIHPLLTVGLLGQEDICIVKQMPDGRHLFVAGFIASPTSWNLPDFIGKDMDETHAKYPDYLSKLKNSVDKLLTSLPPYPERQIVRNNLFIVTDPSLSLRPGYSFTNDSPIVDPGNQIFLRSEYETLTRLPYHSEYIIFTIKPYVFSLADVKAERGSELAEAIQTNTVLNYDHEITASVLEYLS